MYKLCKTEQSARRQRKIEDCLLDIMRTKNFDDITITELCEIRNIAMGGIISRTATAALAPARAKPPVEMLVNTEGRVLRLSL